MSNADVPTVETQEPAQVPVVLRAFRYAVWTTSGLLLVSVWICYGGRFDASAAVTVFPPWCWVALGVFLIWLGFSRQQWATSAVLLLLWLAFLLAVADSPLSVVRAMLPRPVRGHDLRVATLNCASFAAAAREVFAQKPDIVLLQESPTRDDAASLGENVFGPGNHVLWGVDTSIVARGEITPVEIPAAFHANFVHARVALDDNTIDVISLRLFPCPVRIDLWAARCWQHYRTNRETRRRQMKRIAAYVETLPPDSLVVIGGDFNCPPGDAVLRLIPSRYSDSFPIAGRGWGATIIDFLGWPMIRIDQIWTSPQLRAEDAFVRESEFSDHWMAVADFLIERPE